MAALRSGAPRRIAPADQFAEVRCGGVLLANKTDQDPWADVPPDWISLREAAAWIERRFGVPAAEIIPELHAAVRDYEVAHRVAGLDARAPYWPPGLDSGARWSSFPSSAKVVVRDWEAAEVDWRTGTVGGDQPAGAQRSRQSIEVYWPRIERWILGTAASLRSVARAATVQEQMAKGDAQPGANPRGSTARGGRPLHAAKTAFIREMMRRADRDGLMDRLGFTREMIDWAAREFGDDAPSDTTLRDWVKEFWPSGG